MLVFWVDRRIEIRMEGLFVRHGGSILPASDSTIVAGRKQDDRRTSAQRSQRLAGTPAFRIFGEGWRLSVHLLYIFRAHVVSSTAVLIVAHAPPSAHPP